MSHCHCGEFDRPTIAPDEFGETCFHERDKCEVPPVPVPIETVLRLTRARAEKAEAAIQRVRGLHHFVVDEIETREGPEDVQHCSECGYIPTDEEPCPTIRTLDGTENE